MSNRLQSCGRSHSAIVTSAPASRRADSSGGRSSSRLRAAAAVTNAIVGLLIISGSGPVYAVDVSVAPWSRLLHANGGANNENHQDPIGRRRGFAPVAGGFRKHHHV